MHLNRQRTSSPQQLHYATMTQPFPSRFKWTHLKMPSVGYYSKMTSLFVSLRTEKNYAQIEKECLAIVSCMDKWHQYLYGKCDLTVHTDHQPLETIFKKPLSNAPRRLQRMMLKLQKYQFTVRYKKGKELHVADTLSRAAVADHDHSPSSTKQECEVSCSELAEMVLYQTESQPTH